MNKQINNQSKPVKGGLFIELSDESKDELLKNNKNFDKSLFVKDTNILPLGGNFAINPNKN